MPENDGQEKTEDPSQKRIDDSRAEGDVPRSRELTTFTLMFASSVGLLSFSGYFFEKIYHITRRVLTFDKDFLSQQITFAYFMENVLDALAPVVLFMLLLFVVSAITTIFIGGLNFSTKAIMPKFERMDPIKGVKRIFSMNGIVELFKSLGKFVVIGSTGIIFLYIFYPQLVSFGYLDYKTAIYDGLKLVVLAFFLISLSLVTIVLIDVPFQLYQNKKKLRMSKQELKDENKETEGKPEVKSKLRQLQIEFAKSRMAAEIPTADVIITNPTHFAVVIKYNSKKMAAPRVVAKGTDYIARSIISIGHSHKVPVIQHPLLARAVYYSTEIGDHIPRGLYVAVAKVLAFVYRLKRDPRQAKKTESVVSQIEVPTNFKT